MSVPAADSANPLSHGWFGDVPTSWSVSSVRDALTEKSTRNEGQLRSDYLSLVSGVGVIPYEEKGDLGNKKSDDLSNCKLVEVGDFVVNSMNFLIGGFGRSPYQGVCSPVYVVASPDEQRFDPRFLMRVFQVGEFQRHVGRLGNGIMALRMAIGWDELKNQPVPKPPLPDQTRIANFLDEKTARIDALIAEKERLTELLLEEEQSCIDGAVLGGQVPLPHFPFTPATCTVGGAVWRRGSLKRYWRVTDCKHVTVEFVEDGYPLASIREVSSGVLELGDAKRARQEDFLSLIEGGRQPQWGDLIYARNASVGAAAYVDTDEPFAMGQDVCLISSADQDQRFLRLQLMSSPVKAQLEGLLVGATIRRINVEQLRNFVLLVPHPDVQRVVVEATEAQLARRANLRLHLSEHIDRLREYRSSLISAAVTGHLNIDDFQARQLESA